MTDTQLEKIEKFLSGKMEPGEQKNFQQELEMDEELSSAFNTYHFVGAHMLSDKKYASEDAVKSSLSKLGNEFFSTASITNSSILQEKEPVVSKAVQSDVLPKKVFWYKNNQVWKLAAAACVALLVMATWYIVSSKKNVKDPVVIHPKTPVDSIASHKNNVDTATLSYPHTLPLAKADSVNNRKVNRSENTKQKLLAEKYFEPDPAPEDVEGPLEDAFDQYEKKQYASAADAFENADINASTRSEATDTLLTTFYASYYKALSYMAIKKDAKSIPLLKDLVSPVPVLQIKVQWYLALAYLRTGDIPKATSLLQAINENNIAGAYRLKANRLMIELRNQR